MDPILTWAGGKRKILPKIRPYYPDFINTYHEPFLGGGTVLFDLLPLRARINDLNEDLINMYTELAKNPYLFIELLSKYNNTKEEYLQMRDEFNKGGLDSINRGVLMYYLNKTCFHGLWRVNSSGDFNVPYGNRNFDPKSSKVHAILFKTSRFLSGCTITNKDYMDTIDDIQENDFVYLDPPHVYPGGFTNYNVRGFEEKGYAELLKYVNQITLKKARFVLSIPNSEYVIKLFENYEIRKLSAFVSISGHKSARKDRTELIISNRNFL